MPAMLSSSSTATTGTAAPSKSEKTDTQAVGPAWALADVEDSKEDTACVAVMEVAEAASAAVVEGLVVAFLEAGMVEEEEVVLLVVVVAAAASVVVMEAAVVVLLLKNKLPLTPSPIMQPLAGREVSSSMFETWVPSSGLAAPANTVQLPWSTSNEDLVELFTTIGKVERAEIQYEPNGRSRGSGVVEFDGAENAETAICESPFASGPFGI